LVLKFLCCRGFCIFKIVGKDLFVPKLEKHNYSVCAAIILQL
jgi:hypothetical protein